MVGIGQRRAIILTMSLVLVSDYEYRWGNVWVKSFKLNNHEHYSVVSE
jgi:hypothetical protein